MVDFQCKSRYGWEDFLEVMRLLRAPGGCPWDAEQTHQSIRRNFLEETCEALDTLDRDDAPGMCEELGDVLMQVAFHAQIEAERGRFAMEDVVDGVTKKLVYRHPHVFGTVQVDGSEEVLANWEILKRKEKGQQSTADAIEAVPHTLPALWARWKSWRRNWGNCGRPWSPARTQRVRMASGKSWATSSLPPRSLPRWSGWTRRRPCTWPATSTAGGSAGLRAWRTSPLRSTPRRSWSPFGALQRRNNPRVI